MIREKTIFRNILSAAVLLVVGVAASSCSVDEAASVSDINAISFKSVVATRATATTINNFNEFRVWGYAQSGTFMNGVIAENDGTGNFTTTPTYYWPGGSVDFCAISPVGEKASDGSAVISTAAGTEIATYNPEERTIDISVPEDASDQIDLLYAVAADRESGTVNLNFRHALSQIEFKAMSTYSDLYITIYGVSIAGVYTDGTYTLPASTTYNLSSSDDGTYEVTRGSWTVPASAEVEKAVYAAGVTRGTDLESGVVESLYDGSSLFVLPQTVGGWDVLTDGSNSNEGAYFLVDCYMATDTYMFGEHDPIEIWPAFTSDDGHAPVAVPCDIDWQEGCKYTYTFVFGDGAGYYPPTDGSDATPVLVPISFNVSVEDFTTSD